MKRRTLILAAMLGAVLLAAGGWWFHMHFERVPVTHDEPPQPEALHNHYLALERFMARMGRPMVSSGDARTLDKLQPHGVLILDRHHRAILTPARLKALLDWVAKGGYLIVVPEGSDEPDPVMTYLHVHWDDGLRGSCGCNHRTNVPPRVNLPPPATAPASAPAAKPAAAPEPSGAHALAPASAPLAASAPAAGNNGGDAGDEARDDEGDDSEASDDEGDDSEASDNEAGDGEEGDADTSADTHPTTFPARIPGTSRPLAIEMQYAGLAPGDVAPAWEIPLGDHAAWLLDYRHGQGNVSLIANLDQIISNGSIADYDHAEFFWKLLQHFQPTGQVTLMTHLPIPDLFDWLVHSAWTASLSGLLLLALWLWRIAPRFGGTAPDLPPSRRELREHLNAVGRFVWRNEGLGRWLEVARGAFHERLAMRHPAIAALEPPAQAEALARLTALPREQILYALTAGPGNTSEFTAVLRTLKHLKHNL